MSVAEAGLAKAAAEIENPARSPSSLMHFIVLSFDMWNSASPEFLTATGSSFLGRRIEGIKTVGASEIAQKSPEIVLTVSARVQGGAGPQPALDTREAVQNGLASAAWPTSESL